MFSDREGIRKSFTVENFTYVVEYRDRSFYLFIDYARSRDKAALLPVDHGFWDFYEPPPEEVFTLRTPVREVFRVKREVLAFIDPILRKVRPHCFDFLANEERLLPVYTRIAERLARRYGYWCERSGHAFRFYRIEQQAA
jgi:hypothetical protein